MTIYATYRVQILAYDRIHRIGEEEAPTITRQVDVRVNYEDLNRNALVESLSLAAFFEEYGYQPEDFERVVVVDTETISFSDKAPSTKKRKSKEQGTKAQKHGADGQERGAACLGRMGILQLYQVATPYVRIPHPNPKIRGYYKIIEKEKVPGDWNGLLPNGISVLAEVKTRFDANLAWSDFEPHQPAALSAHAEIAVALVVFVHNEGINVLRWPIPGFDGPQKSVTPARAAQLDIQFEPLENLFRR